MADLSTVDQVVFPHGGIVRQPALGGRFVLGFLVLGAVHELALGSCRLVGDSVSEVLLGTPHSVTFRQHGRVRKSVALWMLHGC